MLRDIKPLFMQSHCVTAAIIHNNNETNDKFYRTVAFIVYTEMVNFRPQSCKSASKEKPHRGLGTIFPSS